jgi:Cu/Ag efflux pump CusA
MLRRLVEFSLEFRGVVLTTACMLLAYGILATAQAKLEVFPEFAPPQVVLFTEAPGLSPEEVEALVRPAGCSRSGRSWGS